MKIIAPDDAHPLDIAQAILGPHMLIKAEHRPLKYSERTFRRHPVMLSSVGAFEAAYEAQLQKLMAVIIEYVEREVLLDSLGKSEYKKDYVPLLTPTQLAHIRKLISDYHLAFAATQIDPRVVSNEDVQRLIDIGVLPPDLAYTWLPGPNELPPSAVRAISTAYNYGVVLGQQGALAATARLLTPSVYAALEPPELSTQEQAALTWAEHHAANTIVGLGNTVADDFSTTAIEADGEQRAKYQQDIRDALAHNIMRKESWRKLASDLGHKTGDWARGFKRIAATETQAAVNHGFVAGLVEREGDPKHSRVAKIPSGDACDDCVRLHLTGGQGSAPRIFPLAELIGNGTNVGKRASSWAAIVGPTHPWCGCQLVHIPHGWSFNADNELMPESLSRSQLLAGDLRKANVTYGAVVPDRGVAIRVSDPVKRAAVEAVINRTPPELFDKRVGVTLITHDHPRTENPMDDHDLAYWTGNEIRIATQLPAERIPEVLRHELGHSLNVYLMHKWGGTAPVRKWHNRLYQVSKREGFVSDYAKTLPIENAAETTKLYLYDRRRLVLHYPKTFAVLDAAYRDLWRARERPATTRERIGEPAKQARDARDKEARGGAKL